MEIGVINKMAKISVSVSHGHKTFSAYPFDAYIGEMSGIGRKKGYYIVLAHGTRNMASDVGKRDFTKKADAEKVIRKWLSAKVKQYESEVELKKMKRKSVKGKRK